MIPARSVARSAAPRAASRAARSARTQQQLRLQSTTSSSSSSQQTSSFSAHIAAGMAGGLAAATVLYGAYRVSPTGKMARAVNTQTAELKKKYDEAAAKLQQTTPDAKQTVNYIKDFCYSYVAWIPGGRQYVDSAFRDWEKVHEKHADEADELVSEAYKKLQEVSKSGLSMETARKAADALTELSGKLASLAGDAAGDVLDNHPEVKEKLGGSVDALKKMGEQYGPDAKKQVEETWKQVSEIASKGLNAESLDKARKLVEEKVEALKKMGDEAWKKGMEGAKPYLDKAPKVKELLEKNADKLKGGNAKELFDKVRQAVDSGDTKDLEGYVKKVVEGAKDKGQQAGKALGLDDMLKGLPSGGDIIPKLQQLKEVADKHTEEGEKLVKETIEELKKVLEGKGKKAQEILEKAKGDAKDEAKDAKKK